MGITGKWKKRKGEEVRQNLRCSLLLVEMASALCTSRHFAFQNTCLFLVDENFCSTRVLASKYTREIFIGCVKYGHDIRMFQEDGHKRDVKNLTIDSLQVPNMLMQTCFWQ